MHLAPNANGLLRKWGIFAEDFGATLMQYMEERSEKGDKLKDMDLRGMNAQWQHPWHLSHRINLHEKLKTIATAEDGVGTPARLHTSSKIVSVDAEKGQVSLADGTTVTGDVILGADGIYVSDVDPYSWCLLADSPLQSKSRSVIKETKLFGSGKAAFRFLIPRQAGLDDPVTRPIVERGNNLVIWYGADRRIVMYPCNDNKLLNFNCIHPENESHANASDGK